MYFLSNKPGTSSQLKFSTVCTVTASGAEETEKIIEKLKHVAKSLVCLIISHHSPLDALKMEPSLN